MYRENRLAHNWLLKRTLNRHIAAQLPNMTGVVVDLGCGTRPFETDILAHAETYIGLDWSNTLHGLHADIISDLNAPLPIASDSVDHVTMFEVLEHLPEPGSILTEACRILRPAGRITLTVPFQHKVHEAPWDYYRFTRYGLAYQLEKAGFRDVQVTSTTGFWSMWLVKLNYQLASLVRGPRPIKMLVRCALIPLWWTNQALAPLLDRYWQSDDETFGYLATARKPCR